MTKDWLSLVHERNASGAPTPFGTGDEVRVWYRILEQGKERLGQFEGIVIRQRGSGPSKTFTVRRVTHGEGVERVFPADSKIISRIELLRKGKVKRSRLYFLRAILGKTRIESAEESTAVERASNAALSVDRSSDAQGSGEIASGERSVVAAPNAKSPLSQD